MLLLQLVPRPTGSPPAHTPSGSPHPRLSRVEMLSRPTPRLTLSLLPTSVPEAEPGDYDALVVGGINLLVGGDRVLAVQ